MYKIGILGDRDTVMVFGAIGVDTYSAANEKEARATLKRLAESDYGVLFVTEEMAAPMMDLIKEYDEAITPSIILIPTSKGSLGLGLERINQSVEKAIGMNILAGEATKH